VKRINIEESNERRKLESNASVKAKVVIGVGKLQEMCQKNGREKYKTL
jgi:hypothetical protein